METKVVTSISPLSTSGVLKFGLQAFVSEKNAVNIKLFSMIFFIIKIYK
jgi:hypothetical protein